MHIIRNLKRQIAISLVLLIGIIAVIAVAYIFYYEPPTPDLKDYIVIAKDLNTGTSDLAFSPDGTLIAAAHSDGHIRVWDVENRELLHDFFTPTRRQCQVRAVSVDFSADGKEIAAGKIGGEVQVWNLGSGQPRLIIDIHPNQDNNCYFNDARYSPDGSEILTTSGGETLRAWDAQTGEFLDYVGLYQGPRISYHPSGQWIATGQSADYIELHIINRQDPNEWQNVPIPNATNGLNTNDLQFSPDGHWLAAATANGKFHVWDTSDWPDSIGDAVTEQHNPDFLNTAFGVRFNPTSDLLAVSGDFPIINLWRIRREDGELSLEKVANIDGHGPMDFSPDGKWLASMGNDGSIRLWDVRDVRD